MTDEQRGIPTFLAEREPELDDQSEPLAATMWFGSNRRA
jgi:hypothetical protein